MRYPFNVLIINKEINKTPNKRKSTHKSKPTKILSKLLKEKE